MKETLHIYTRVSTSNQVGNTSIDEQKDNGKTVSKTYDLDIKYWDEGQGSGFEDYSEGRPIFSELLENIKNGKIKHLFVKDLSRLTRNQMDSFKIQSILLDNKVTLYTENGKFDLSSIENSFMYKQFTIFNEYMVQTTRMKSIQGRVRRVREGKYMLTIPFGYIREDGYLKEHPENGEWVRKMFEWYMDGKSSVDISKELFKNGVQPTRSETGFHPKDTILSRLKNDVYIGKYTYHDTESGVTIIPNPSNVPPLIEKKLFYDVQKKIKNSKSGGHNIRKVYLLRDIIECVCGTQMNCKGDNSGKNIPLYRCRNQERTYQKRKKVCNNCVPMRSVKMKPVDDFVWNTLLYTLSQSSMIKETVKKEILGKKTTYGKRTIKNSLNKLKGEKENLDTMRLELQKEYYSGQMTKDRYDILVGSVNERENDLDTEIHTKQMELDVTLKKDKWLDWIEVHLNNIDDLNKITEIKERKKVIQTYINKISLDWNETTKQHTMDIIFKLPLVNDGLRYKKGKSVRFLRDKKGFKKYEILEGKKDLKTPYLLQELLNSNAFSQIPRFVNITSTKNR